MIILPLLQRIISDEKNKNICHWAKDGLTFKVFDGIKFRKLLITQINNELKNTLIYIKGTGLIHQSLKRNNDKPVIEPIVELFRHFVVEHSFYNCSCCKWSNKGLYVKTSDPELIYNCPFWYRYIYNMSNIGVINFGEKTFFKQGVARPDIKGLLQINISTTVKKSVDEKIPDMLRKIEFLEQKLNDVLDGKYIPINELNRPDIFKKETVDKLTKYTLNKTSELKNLSVSVPHQPLSLLIDASKHLDNDEENISMFSVGQKRRYEDEAHMFVKKSRK